VLFERFTEELTCRAYSIRSMCKSSADCTTFGYTEQTNEYLDASIFVYNRRKKKRRSLRVRYKCNCLPKSNFSVGLIRSVVVISCTNAEVIIVRVRNVLTTFFVARVRFSSWKPSGWGRRSARVYRPECG